MAATGSQQVTVDGRVLALTNLDKVLYPATGTTKGEVIAYYAEVGAVQLPHVRQRPITRKRWPDGVGLGLALVSTFARRQQGQVRCVSREGVGTIFELSIPVL